MDTSGNAVESTHFNIDTNGTMYIKASRFDVYSLHTMHYKEWLANIHPDDIDIIENTMYLLLTDEITSAEFDFQRRNIDGTYLPLKCSCKVTDHHGIKKIEATQASYSPEFEMDLHISHHHWITSPYHFYHYSKLLEDMLKIEEEKANCTLFYFNIAKLKSIVNHHGYDVLDEIYDCIFNALNDYSIYPISRYQSILGNFVVIVGSYLNESNIEHICNCILSYTQLKQPNPKVDQCNMSIGVINLPSDAGSPRNILKHVARASEYALNKTEKRWAIHKSNDSPLINRHFYIEKELVEAIHNDELTVKFQPILDAKSGKTSSMEILSRWENSQLGEIYPDEFIPVAESQLLINQLGWQVLHKACEFISALPSNSDLKININVSVLQLQDTQFASQALQIVSDYRISPERIVIEITESLMLDKSSIASLQILALSQLSFQLSLDDFGSGYSTLNSLFSLPINQIKLDRETANQGLKNKEAMNYIQFLIDMCHRNNVQFVVEGIETLEMSERYTKKNAHCLQGYYFSKPMSFDDALKYLHENSI